MDEQSLRPASENWPRAYREAPEIFDAFSRAEDPDGLVVRRLLTHLDLEGRSMLEIGCGTGRYTRELARHAGRTIALEPEAEMLRRAQARCLDAPGRPSFLRAAAQRIPLPAGSVDVVVAAWVLVHLPSAIRAEVMTESLRVLSHKRDSGLWALGNHWSGEFHDLRGPHGLREKDRTIRMIDTFDFSVVDVVETELRFPSARDAQGVLGYLCGETVREELRRRGAAVVGHHVLILHRPLAGSVSPAPRSPP